MKIISTNIAKPTTFTWRGKEITTGINKKPVDEPIYLGKEDVKGDIVSNRKHHGGVYKACYLFSSDYYEYWERLYPNLDWHYGMLGENLTIKGLDETKIFIGDIYKVGEALIQITQPREPCYIFGVKFGSQKVLKQFIEHNHSGTYVSVLKEGFVKTGDILELVEHQENSLTTSQFFELLFSEHKNQELLTLALQNEALPLKKREKLSAFVKS
jgi:MOSC domain-containing protein YiiM